MASISQMLMLSACFLINRPLRFVCFYMASASLLSVWLSHMAGAWTLSFIATQFQNVQNWLLNQIDISGSGHC